MKLFIYHVSTSNYCSEVQLFAVNQNRDERDYSETVCLRVQNFTRHCYVSTRDVNDVVRYVNDEYGKRQWKDDVAHAERVDARSYYDYELGSSSFVKCRVKTKSAMRKLVEALNCEKARLSIDGIYEHSVDDVCQFTSVTKIPTVGWVDVTNYSVVTNESDKVSKCALELVVAKYAFVTACDCYDGYDLKTMSFDIEVYSEVANAFPADRPGDAIFQISAVVSNTKRVDRRYLLTLRGDDRRELDSLRTDVGIVVEEFDDESSLIEGFCSLFNDEMPNVVAGYNIFGFDVSYVVKRAARYGLVEKFYNMGFVKRKNNNALKKIRWSSSAASNQDFEYVDWPGVLVVDLLPVVKNILQMKLPNYKLDSVAFYVLNEGKDSVTVKDIFTSYETRQFARVGKYCVRDSELCTRIIDECFVLQTLCELARASNVVIATLYTRGQQIRVFSNVYKYCHEKGIVVNQPEKKWDDGNNDDEGDNDNDDGNDDEKFVGATVFEPKPGMYENVIPFDFSSLYPSIMISNNICPTTLKPIDVDFDESRYVKFAWSDHINCEHDENVIGRDELAKRIDDVNAEISRLMAKRDGIDSCYAKFVGSTVSKCRYAIQAQINELRRSQSALRLRRGEFVKRIGSKNKICGDREYCFLKSTVRVGVLPTISLNLVESRRSVKKLYESESDPAKKIILNARQLALKIIANSVYGSTGVKKGYLPCMPCAMTVTYVGRKSTLTSANFIRETFGGNLVYGDTDSNYITFPSFVGSYDDLWTFVKNVADRTSDLFPRPMKLEFEGKIYEKFIIFAKKRYITKERYLDGKISTGYRGIVLARRDNCQYLRDIYSDVIAEIFRSDWSRQSADDRQAVINVITDRVDAMFTRAVPNDKYVVTKSVKNIGDENEASFGDYKLKLKSCDAKLLPVGMTERQFHVENSSCPGQVVLAEKMRRRGTPVDAGSRLEYVVLDDGSCNESKVGCRMEDYDYFKDRTEYARVDALYYLKTFVQSLDQLVETTVGIVDLVKRMYDARRAYAKCWTERCRVRCRVVAPK